MNPVLVEVLRGAAVESVHTGALAVVDADGAWRCRLGDVARPIFPRSAVKLLQALPLVESGAADWLGLGDAELALSCASHNGEPRHVNTAAAMLARSGLDAGVLECGTHWPMHEPTARALAAAGGTPGPLHNNCSGKHAGFVCLACAGLAADGDPARWRAGLSGYIAATHPVMQAVDAALAAATRFELASAPVGIDGCSIPTHAIPLANLARAFAGVGTGVGLPAGLAHAAQRLRAAVAREPFMTAGSGRCDTRVMARFGARVYCKVGAEGVYCAALPEQGLGVALKIDDGHPRAAEAAMAAVVEACARLDDGERAFMRTLSDVALSNWRGIATGRVRASAPLRRALG